MHHTKSALSILMVASGAFALNAQAAPGGVPGAPEGKGKPSVEVSNNLSYPAVFTGTAPTFALGIGDYQLNAAFPDGVSYSCPKPETIGTSVYPNTSCVTDTGTPISKEECVAVGAKCEGYTVDRLEPIYWQKNASNLWQAGYVGNLGAIAADFIDWGDNLESTGWKTTSIIRVETNAFATLTEGTPPETTTRFDMWHVFGQGTNELWGVHATNSAVPYVYSAENGNAWPFAVINSSNARLNIAKLQNGPATCPDTPVPSPVTPTWTGTEWDGTWLLRDISYTAELNIKGSYVFGYNWNLKTDVVPPDVNKAGWWRLTFYTSDDSILFDDAGIPTEPPSSEIQPLPAAAVVAAEEGDTGPLYAPVVDAANNLSYIDICISEGNSKGGGGGGSGGGGSGGGGGGGGGGR